MNYFAVHYSYADGAEAVVALRPEHREFLKTLRDEGTLVASGPYTDGGGSALILLRLPESATVADAEALMNQDPFHRDRVLDGRTIRAWNPVLNIFPEG